MDRLLPFMEGVVPPCKDDRFCRVEETQEGMALILCGKLHMGTIGGIFAPDSSRHAALRRAQEAECNQGILERLASAETENNVRILYAFESGSRAWGYTSQDSDFDVRFIYVHPPE
ncbi:MAG: nucleotidyltransferase domain-containing protein [Desulfovibrio sp.]|nr:nucleotidyltransferase domain-containing protein [Desulfovibrio sp.]